MNPEIEALTAQLKKANDDFKRDNAAKLMKSDNPNDREMAASWAKAAADDTATMEYVSRDKGRRLDAKGKPYGPVLEKNPVTGNYITESEQEDEKKRESRRGLGYASGGLVHGDYWYGKKAR